MFIRFSLPKMFRLRGRSRKEKSHPIPSDAPAPEMPTFSEAPAPPLNFLADDPFASDPVIIRSSPELRVQSSLRRRSSLSISEMQIPIIVIQDHDDSTIFELVKTSVTPDESQLKSLPPPKSVKARPLSRSKSVLFSLPSSDSAERIVRRATMTPGPARRNTKRETKIVFKRNSRGETQMKVRRNSKQQSQIESKRESKQVSRMPKERRQSRWQKEINDPDTQEVLRALSNLSNW